MSTVLESLGFIVSLHRDLDSSAILEIAKEFSSSKRTDCFLFYFSGHGDHDSIFGDDELPVGVIDIIELFQHPLCQFLDGTPKIFLWDCCRGQKFDTVKSASVAKTYRMSLSEAVELSSLAPKTIPTKFVDSILCYASAKATKLTVRLQKLEIYRFGHSTCNKILQNMGGSGNLQTF
eukprot:TRINITY_DN2264_c0_g1_i7.p1 TRINITY_DN2264_c0_g1~~TRINITY_DN2264_c0_g1_i7.p1  ORF type:complete len:177 (-),score=25.09 TRINITY_DN2264_c0_g1_i7:186-716(-)